MGGAGVQGAEGDRTEFRLGQSPTRLGRRPGYSRQKKEGQTSKVDLPLYLE